MLIPKCPRVGPKPPFTFGDSALYQAQQDIGREIVDCLRWMQKATVVPSYQDMLGRFIAAVPCTSGVRDPGRLPYQASGPNDRTNRGALSCVYTRLSWLIQAYWGMCIDGVDNAALIRGHLDWARAVWSAGVMKCKVVGSPRDGWTLEVT